MSIPTSANVEVHSELTIEEQEKIIQETKFIDLCGKILKKIMLEHDLTNIKLAGLAKLPEPYISRLRNGSLAQRNYIKIIRALPIAARIDYLFKVFDLNEDELNAFLVKRRNQRK
jgi:transcriptional regulator with XRE-family HTH domain